MINANSPTVVYFFDLPAFRVSADMYSVKELGKLVVSGCHTQSAHYCHHLFWRCKSHWSSYPKELGCDNITGFGKSLVIGHHAKVT